jgi:hypothetical protein
MTTTYISFDNPVHDFEKRQEILQYIRLNIPEHRYTWSKYKEEDSFTNDILGVTLNEEDAIILRLRCSIWKVGVKYRCRRNGRYRMGI